MSFFPILQKGETVKRIREEVSLDKPCCIYSIFAFKGALCYNVVTVSWPTVGYSPEYNS